MKARSKNLLSRAGALCMAGIAGLYLCSGGGFHLKAAEEISTEQLRLRAKSDPAAQFQLGQRYVRGEGVPQNFKEAFNWFKKAAKDGHMEAQYHLGFSYATGAGVKSNLTDAAAWYLKAAKQGHAEAQFKVAACYERGLGVKASKTEAMQWYRRAAEQMLPDAQSKVAEEARLAEDYVEAVKWYNLAAVRGSSIAQYWLGILYRNGQGVEKKDFVEAYKWFLIAAENGFEPAHQQLEDLSTLKSYGMTPTQIAQAEQRAKTVRAQIKPPML